jgi:hypothetical protein
VFTIHDDGFFPPKDNSEAYDAVTLRRDAMRLFQALAIFACLSFGTTSTAPAEPWFVIAGQSNATGQSTQPIVDSTPFENRLYSYVYTFADEMVYLNDPIYPNGPNSNRKSAWPTLAIEWMSNRDEPISIAQTAYGGSCLVHDQHPYPSFTDPSCLPEVLASRLDKDEGGQFYCWMRLQINELIDSGQMSMQDFKAVLFDQGECDVAFCESKADYKAELKEFADNVYAEWGKPVVVTPVGEHGASPYDPACLEAIHDGSIEAAAEHEQIYLGPSRDDLAYQEDGVHLHDMETYGKRWYLVLDALLSGVAAPCCTDGYDNDDDGLSDYPSDPGCRNALSDLESPQCQDGQDNDGDTLIDFDGGLSALGYVAADPDPNCPNPYKNSETASSSTCGLGVELTLLLPPLMWLSPRRRRRS